MAALRAFARSDMVKMRPNSCASVTLLVAEQRIALDPRHVRLRDVCNMAPGTLGRRCFCGELVVRQRVVAEGEEAPAVGLREPLAVLHRHVDAVVLAVEVATSGGFLARTVRKRRGEHARQLLHDDSSFGEGPGLQVRVDVLLLHVDVVILGKARLAVSEAVSLLWSALDHPLAET